MTKLDNTRQIVRQLLLDTNSGKIRWWCTYDESFSKQFVFKYVHKITKKKAIDFRVMVYRDSSNLTINYITDIEKGNKTYIDKIENKKQSMIYDLVDSLIRKYKDGDIPLNLRIEYLNENKVNEFNSDDGRTKKVKDIQLISSLAKDTIMGKLEWKVSHKEDNMAVFMVNVPITPLKKLVFSLRCQNSSKYKEDNILKCILKTSNLKGDISHNTTVIKSVNLNDNPSLIYLIKKLCKTYLDRDFKLPPKEIVNPTKLIIANNIIEYRKYVMDVVKEIMKNIPDLLNYDDKFASMNDIYEEMKKAESFEKLNDLLYRAHQKSERNNPVGTPIWNKY